MIRPRPKAQLSLFDDASTKPENTTEYCFASDLYKISGRFEEHPTYITIVRFINTAFNDILNGSKHIVGERHQYTLGGKNFYNDYKLSPYACYKLVNDPCMRLEDKFLKAYFMMPNAKFHEVENTHNRILRVEMREYVSDTMKSLRSMIKQAGGDYEKIIQGFYQDLFNVKYSNEDLKRLYKIPHNETILNYLGEKTLMHIFRILHNTEIYFKELHPDANKLNSLKNALHDKTLEKRQEIISSQGILPERDIRCEHINKAKKTLEQIEKKFISDYSQKTLH